MNHGSGAHHREDTAIAPALHAQAQLLRVRVEAELARPAVIMVTSAREGDGKSLTAYSLAAALVQVDHRVALVSRSSQQYDQLPIVEMPNDGGSSRERLATFIDAMRAEYDFTVIDADTFVKSSTAMTLAHLVDGVLLAVRIGRAPTADDESMVGLLEQLGSRVVGVVATEGAAITEFEALRRKAPASGSSRPRQNTEQSPVRAAMTVAAERVFR
jgi:Mrp family chromosome partitioning ATPase